MSPLRAFRWLMPLLMSAFCLSFAPAGRGAGAPLSQWVYPSPSGQLLYRLDERGQRIADCSQVGFRSGTAPLPDVTKLIESNRWVFVSPIAGDNTASIQATINQVSALSLNSNGFRGVVFLNAGEYQLSNTISISAAGVVLKGVSNSSNSGSRLRATAPRQYTLVSVDGAGARSTVSGTTHNFTQTLVPAGARTFAVDSTSGLAVGHLVRVKRPSTTNWIADIDMDQLTYPWTAGSKDLYFDRVITRIEGNWITVDAPLPQTFETLYGGGQIYRYTWSRTENIGIEDLYGVSDYDGTGTDEEHAWTFISVRDAQHCWVRNITAQYFGNTAVVVTSGSKWVTVADAQCLDPISVIDGGRRYAFFIADGDLALYRDNYSTKGRHDFVIGASVPGPHVFVHGRADTVYADTGPHHRWSVGSLFDEITINGNELNIRNRGNLGTGHGWSGAYMTAWNSAASAFRVRNPPTARNWLIGSIGSVGASLYNVGADPEGTYDLSGPSGTNVHPRSLYYAQLQQRMKWPFSDFREYWLGDVDQFASTNATGEVVSVETNWLAQVQAAAGATATGAAFDYVAGNRWVAFTFNFILASNEQVKAASLTLSLRGVDSGSADDALYLGSVTNQFSFASLGWSIGTNGSSVQTLEIDPALLTGGRLNVALQDDTAVDFATLHLQVAPIIPAITNTLTPVADALTRAGASAALNFGTATTLTTKSEGNSSDNTREAFLRWDLAGMTGQLVQARVRLFCVNTGQSNNENCAAFVSNDAWSETTVNWSNKPSSGSLFAQWLPVTGQSVEFIVTPQVADALLGDGKLSLRIFSPQNFGGSGFVDYGARENSTTASRPQLILLFSNTPPVLSNLTNYNGAANTPLGPLPFTIGDAETAPATLLLSATSSNPTLVPNANITFGGSNANRTVTLTPASNQTGSATITLTLSDGGLTASDTFIVSFGAGNTPPLNSNVADRTTPEDVPLVVPFTVSDAETAAGSLLVTATSSNTNLISNSTLVLGGSSSNRLLTLTPAPDANGVTTLTLIVSDGFLTATDTFVLTVTAVNDAPEFVEVTSPADGEMLRAGTAFTLTADAFDVDNNLARVEFYQGASRLGTDTNAPYTAIWANPLAGSYTISAIATDTSGLSVTSAAVHLTVQLPAATLVATGAVWRYFDQSTDLNTAWRAPDYDDRTWPAGPAQLGFGDGDEATTVVSNRARITTYFRHSFVATNPADFASLTLNLLRDDGAVVYLNGSEVFRSNMPTGTIAWATFAASGALIEDESTNYYPIVLRPWTLRPGTNVLAVEVHQSSASSSDISFDLALSGELLPAQTFIPPGAAWRYLDTGVPPAPTWPQLSYSDSAWPSGPARLGYGGDGETTVVSFGPSPTNKYITTWFRHVFTVADPAVVKALELQFQRDDAVLFYLNGAEVHRSNLPGGTITPSTKASTAVGTTNETRWFNATLSPGALLAGANVLAAEVHQSETNSSDLGFDCTLSGLVAVPQAVVMQARLAGSTLLLTAPGDAFYATLFSTTNLASPITWTPATNTAFLSNDLWNARLPVTSNGLRFFRLQTP